MDWNELSHCVASIGRKQYCIAVVSFQLPHVHYHFAITIIIITIAIVIIITIIIFFTIIVIINNFGVFVLNELIFQRSLLMMLPLCLMVRGLSLLKLLSSLCRGQDNSCWQILWPLWSGLPLHLIFANSVVWVSQCGKKTGLFLGTLTSYDSCCFAVGLVFATIPCWRSVLSIAWNERRELDFTLSSEPGIW